MSDNNHSPAKSSRRNFLGILGWLITGLVGSIMGIAGSLYAIYPSFSRKGKASENSWQPLDKLEAIPQGASKHTVNISERAGWAEANTQQAVWVVRQDSQIKIFSGVCPHEGCTVTDKPQGFVCLCHMSEWQIDGHKISGPTPRDLDTLDYRVNGSQLEVKYENFQRGVSQKIPLS